MFKYIINVALLLYLSLQIQSLDSGDDCDVIDKLGICKPLKECKPIDDEVRKTGNNIPLHMRKKLQELNCGYVNRDPLICCPPLETTNQKPDEGKPFQGIIGLDTSGTPTSTDDKINLIGSGVNNNDDNVEAFTRRGESMNANGPPDIEKHPNLHLLPRECGRIEGNRINGGNITDLFEMPWMVLLSYQSVRGIKSSCGGTIINEWYILTAAHCVAFLGNIKLRSVIIGEYDTRQDPDCVISAVVPGDKEPLCAASITDATIDSVIAHPGYTPKTLSDDIALIRLAKPANFALASVKPLCLPLSRELQMQNLTARKVVAAGWGATENFLPSPVLLSVELPVVDHKRCEETYNRTIGIGMGQICAGGVKDQDSCSGDSGGPIMYPGIVGKAGSKYVQRGIVSFGPKLCGLGKFPGVYTNVAYYMDWILNNMRS